MKRKLFNSAVYTTLFLWMFGTVYPFIWVLINSFKDKNSIVNNSFSIPITTFTLENYREALFGKYEIWRAYINSFIISGSVVVVVILLSVFAAFAMSRFDFKGKKIVFGLLVASMMFPIFSTIFPLFRMLVTFGVQGEYIGVILPQIAGNVAFATILLSGFISNLPVELEESAHIDGANIFQIIFKVIIPNAKSAIASAAIFVFLWSYNDLFLQMIILKDVDKMPISALLLEISSKEGGTNYGLMVAAVALIALPILVLYLFLQKHIIEGLTAGAIKG